MTLWNSSHMLTLFILMNFPIYIDTISMDMSILYFTGSLVKISIFFILANSADPDEMLHYVAFHLGLHCLPIMQHFIWVCTVCQSTCLQLSRMKGVKSYEGQLLGYFGLNHHLLPYLLGF